MTKMTKNQKAERANDYRVELAQQMGYVAGGNTEAEIYFYQFASKIMGILGISCDGGHFPFVNLINCANRHGYRPTLRADLDPLYTVLADAYDFEQARRGSAYRAYRGN